MLRDVKPTLDVRYIMVGLSYRGYWTSSGRPSERGIDLDAQAALNWVVEQENHSQATIAQADEREVQVNVILWGQSIGSGIATTLAANQDLFCKNVSLQSLILETPFLNTRSMLQNLYPQKWLPYQYLWPFLRTHLDSYAALETMTIRAKLVGSKTPEVVILEAGRDELVPSSHGRILEQRCEELGLVTERKVIDNAFHQDVLVRAGGRQAVVDAVKRVAGTI